jgi:hypothetical protein
MTKERGEVRERRRDTNSYEKIRLVRGKLIIRRFRIGTVGCR